MKIDENTFKMQVMFLLQLSPNNCVKLVFLRNKGSHFMRPSVRMKVTYQHS